MTPLKASQTRLFIGKKVRVTYPLDRGIMPVGEGYAGVVDEMITGEVVLRDYDPTTQEVTFERPGGLLVTMRPTGVFPVE